MATQLRRWQVALLVALLTLLIAHWFDAGVLTDAQLRAAHPGLLFYLGPVAHILTAAGVVVLALIAWWSRSLLVGACYAVVGGCLVFLPVMYWRFASWANPGLRLLPGNPFGPTNASLPEALLRQGTLADWFTAVSTGVTGAVFTLAAAMLLAGLVVIGSVLRAYRQGPTAASPATAQAPHEEPA